MFDAEIEAYMRGLSEPKPVEKEEEPPMVSLLIDSLPMNERRRWMIKVVMIVRNEIRTSFGLAFANQCGHFLDYHLSKDIHSFMDWIEYPKGDCVLKGHSKYVSTVVTSKDGYHLFSGSGDKSIIHWNLVNHAMMHQWKAHNHTVMCLDHYCPGLLVSGSWDKRVRLWDSCDHSLKCTMIGHTGYVWTVRIDPMNPTMVVSGATDNTLRLWSTIHGDCLAVFKDHSDDVKSVFFMREWSSSSSSSSFSSSSLILSGSDDKSIKLWDSCSKSKHPRITTALRTFREGIRGCISDMSVNCDCDLIACCYRTGFSVFEWPEMRVVMNSDVNATHLCFHPFQRDVLIVSDKKSSHCIRFYHVGNSEEWIRILEDGHSESIEQLCFTPDGSRVISASDDQTIRIWTL